MNETIIMRIFKKNIIPALIVLFILNGCWYSFSEKAFPQIKSVAVIPFENETGEYDLASQTTDLLTQKVLNTSTYELSSAEDADGIVSGKIIYYKRKVNTYDEAENPIDYIIDVRARTKFIERTTNKILWEATFEGYATFAPDGDENQAKENAVKILVEKIFDRMRSG